MHHANRTLIIASCFALLSVSAWSQGLPKKMNTTPCEANALPAAASILEYLGALTMDKAEGVISGQNCYHGNQCTSKDPIDGYGKMVTALHEETGKWVAMVGIDYEYERIFSRQELSEANAVLIDHWKAGGLVTINWAPLNHWVTQDNGGPVNIGSPDGPGGTRDQSKVKLGELVDPKSAVYANWHRMLDRVADSLLELQQSGVVVLWRPMQEMSGDLDGVLIAKRLKKDFPAVAYWVSWHSWPTNHWSIISLKNPKELMNDPYVITRDDLKLHD